MPGITPAKLTMQAAPWKAFVADWSACGRATQPTDASCYELAYVIHTEGQHTPVVVRVSGPNGNPTRTIVAGHRRWIATRLIAEGFEFEHPTEGLVEVHDPQAVLKFTVAKLSAEEAFAVTISENVDRKDLSVVDLAVLARTGMDRYGYSATEMGRRLRCSSTAIGRYLRVLQFDEKERAMIGSGAVTFSTALAIADVADAEERCRLMSEAAASPSGARDTVAKLRDASPVKIRRNVAALRRIVGPESDGTSHERTEVVREVIRFLDGDQCWTQETFGDWVHGWE